MRRGYHLGEALARACGRQVLGPVRVPDFPPPSLRPPLGRAGRGGTGGDTDEEANL
jgi:hypothetical protein